MRRAIRAMIEASGIAVLAAILAHPLASAMAAELVVFHADSLAGPLRALKGAYESAHPGVTLVPTPGVSKQLAERIVNGDACDVFAPSSPAVIDDDLLRKPLRGTANVAATWYVVFSANEMVVITAKGNPLGIRRAADLGRADVRFIRVTGNAATVPATARNPAEATAFVAFLLSPEAQAILGDTGQPPVVPALRRGAVPAAVK